MKLLVWVLAAASLGASVFGHGGVEEAASPAVSFLKLSAVFLVALVIVALVKRKLTAGQKKILFIAICLFVLAPTLFMGFSTIRENLESVTKGPVHWHADYIVEVCGERLDLGDPEFMANRVGDPLLHEHDDSRMHIEGAVRELEDVSLHAYFEKIGGELAPGRFAYPSDKGLVEKQDGDACAEGPGTLKVYVNGRELSDFEYVPYPDSYVPPGDCIVVRFAAEHGAVPLCESWESEGWSYDSFVREPRQVGEMSWR